MHVHAHTTKQFDSDEFECGNDGLVWLEIGVFVVFVFQLSYVLFKIKTKNIPRSRHVQTDDNTNYDVSVIIHPDSSLDVSLGIYPEAI